MPSARSLPGAPTNRITSVLSNDPCQLPRRSAVAELLKTGALVLGLAGMSEVVREGLRLLHKRARELALAAEYDQFYGSQPAPLPDGVVPADAD